MDRNPREEILARQPDNVRTELEKLLSFDDRPQGADAGGLLYQATEYFTPFPKPESVFAEDVETHAKYLLPLATVSLDHVNPEWSGPIHFVQPIEPFDGVIGEDTPSHHGPLCAANWVGYHMNEDGKYTLATSWDFFLLHNVESRTDIQIGADATRRGYEHYESARKSYAKNRGHFQQHGGLHPEYSLEEYGFWRDRDRHELVMQLGAEPGWGNWPENTDWPLSEHESQSDDAEPGEMYPLPQADDGSDFAYVGCIKSFVYIDYCGCDLLLFYHPELRLALTTFDWS